MTLHVINSAFVTFRVVVSADKLLYASHEAGPLPALSGRGVTSNDEGGHMCHEERVGSFVLPQFGDNDDDDTNTAHVTEYSEASNPEMTTT
jgi:hypothetical protein